jgi:alpha-tubulin suppressor-like RCC1 family protein
MSIYAFGINNYSQCGDHSTHFLESPTKSKTLANLKIKKISCGEVHTLVQLENGKLYGMGSNHVNQLGK